jgi:hypothetical protein
MALLPIDLQMQFAQLGRLGQIVHQGELGAVNAQIVAGEHVKQMSRDIDNTVTHTEKIAKEGSTITGDGGGSKMQSGSKGKEGGKKDSKAGDENLCADPLLGSIIDITE